MSADGKRILYFTPQPVYEPGKPATGGGLRAYGIGRALEDCGHDVLFSQPGTGPEELRHNILNIPEVISRIGPDVVILGNWGMSDRVDECPVPTVVDINGSLILENHYRGNTDLMGDILGKLRALEKVDLVLAGSFRQKMYLASWCLLAGMPPESLAVAVIPFSMPSDMPETRPPSDPVFIMAGYRWPWLHGQGVVSTVCEELGRLKKGAMEIYTSDPPYFDLFPDEDSRSDHMGTLEAGKVPRVRVRGSVPFDDLTGILSGSTVALDLWPESLERELAVSTRAVVYLWSGLPIITNRTGGLSDLVHEYAAGWTMDPGDTLAIARLVRSIVEEPAVLEKPREGVRRLVRERFNWKDTITPLDEFCRIARTQRYRSPVLKLVTGLEDTVIELDQVRVSLEEEKEVREKEKEALQEKALRQEREAGLMGEIHRRPQGLEVLSSVRLLRGRLRRIAVGVPVLLYLLILARCGEILASLRERVRLL